MDWGGSGELESLVALELGGDFRPAALDLLVKAVEINGNNLWLVGLEKLVHCGVQLAAVNRLWKVAADSALAVVFDSHGVAECSQEVLLATHQPSLQEVFTNAAAGLVFEGVVKPCKLLFERLAFNEDGSKLPLPGKSGNRGLVNTAVLIAKPSEHFVDNILCDGGVNFVGFHNAGGWWKERESNHG